LVSVAWCIAVAIVSLLEVIPTGSSTNSVKAAGPGARSEAGLTAGARRIVDFDAVEGRGAGTGGDLAAVPTAAAPVASSEHLDRILTVPNLVTLVRLLCIPLFLWLLFGAHRQTASAFLLGALGATDWVDGFVARRYHQVSTLGKVIDPVADRLLVITSVVAITVYGAVPVWFGAATLARELLVSAAVLLLASLGAARMDVIWVGKAGTFALMFAYPAFLLSDGTASWQVPFRAFAWFAGIGGLTLAWIAAFSYVPVARQALAAGRRTRSERASR
jgi:cardiolipin synthase